MGQHFFAMTATRPFCVFALFVVQQRSHIQNFPLTVQSVVLSLKTNSSRRRSKHDIIAQMLDVAKMGVGKTDMMYKASLSFLQLNDYLELLLKNELLENTTIEKNRKLKTIYKLTDKGMEYLNAYQDMDSLLTI